MLEKRKCRLGPTRPQIYAKPSGTVFSLGTAEFVVNCTFAKHETKCSFVHRHRQTHTRGTLAVL